MTKMVLILKIFGGALIYGILYLIRESTFVQGYVVGSVLQLACVYPKTKSLSLADPLVTISSLDEFDKENIEIKRTDLYYQLPPVIDVLKSSPNDYMIEQIDMIVINKMGVEVLVVDFEKEGKGRSLFLELTRVRTQVIQYTNGYIYVTMFVYFLISVITNETTREITKELLKKGIDVQRKEKKKKKK